MRNKRWYTSQTFLLALAAGVAAACFVFVAAKPPAYVDVLVLVKDKDANERLIASDFKLIGVNTDNALPGAISGYSKIKGRRLKYPRLAGDQIVERSLFSAQAETNSEAGRKGDFVYAGIRVENYSAIADFLDPGSLINIQFVPIGQPMTPNGSPNIIEKAKVIGVAKTSNGLAGAQDQAITVMLPKQDGLRLGEYALTGKMFITINAGS